MSSYNDLYQALSEAFQHRQLVHFIEQRKKILQYQPWSFLDLLFLARAYELAGEIPQAASSYAALLKIARKNNPNLNRLLGEIKHFISSHGHESLLIPVAGESISPGSFGFLQDLENGLKSRRIFENLYELNSAFLESIQLEQIDIFIEHMHKSIKESYNDYYNYWRLLVRAYKEQEKLDEVADAYTRILQLDKEAGSHLKLREAERKTIVFEIQDFIDKTGYNKLVTIANDILEKNILCPSIQQVTLQKEIKIKWFNLKRIYFIFNLLKRRIINLFKFFLIFSEEKNQDNSINKLSKTNSLNVVIPVSNLVKNSINKTNSNETIRLKRRGQTNLLKAKKFFDGGNLEAALEQYKQAYNYGDRSKRLFAEIAATLHRLERFDEAIEWLTKGISVLPSQEQLSLLAQKAQFLSSQQRWNEAAEIYEEVMRLEQRSAARREYGLQLSRIYYLYLKKFKKAQKIINQLLKKDPQDQVALRQLSLLEQAIYFPSQQENISPETDALYDDVEEVILPEDSKADIVSPMLQRDIASAEFRDEEILRRGGHPEERDAKRLLEQAKKMHGSEFAERYPLFLEASKAYNELPEGTYNEGDFHESLNRYASLKAGTIVLQFQRLVVSGHIELLKLRRLRDSVSSYSLESLALQVTVSPQFTNIPLKNYLLIQVAFTLVLHEQTVPPKLFEYSLSEIMTFCLEHVDEKLLYIAYEMVISSGTAGQKIWHRWKELDAARIFWQSLAQPDKRDRAYKILSTMSQETFNIEQKPKEVLGIAFIKRREQLDRTQEFFNRLQQILLIVKNFGELQGLWERRPIYQGILLDTDQEICNGVSVILTMLLPYQNRSSDERTAIIYNARINIENLLRFIYENPTYWGRVGFEPLLNRWKLAIEKLEKKRLSDEIHPKLVARLEPPIFYQEKESIKGGIIVQNEGRGTADGATLTIEVIQHNSQDILLTLEIPLSQEIAVGKSQYYSLDIPIDKLVMNFDRSYHLNVQIAPIFRQQELEIINQEFTLEIASGSRISYQDIPWSETKLPSKQLFKGREELINHLITHLESPERDKTYILFGLTRTGKSSVLHYLNNNLDLKSVQIGDCNYQFISFYVELNELSAQNTSKDMWNKFLKNVMISKLKMKANVGEINLDTLSPFIEERDMSYNDWEVLISSLKFQHFYPVFLFDEFSYFRSLVDKGLTDASFLAAMRSFAIDGQASFICAGTYDVSKFIKDSNYILTGQFINTKERQISSIERQPAIDLIQIMGNKLRFTEDAVERILRLSYQIPYFIQIICKNCALYAMNLERSIMGIPEVETVIENLSGESRELESKGINVLPRGIFMNNMEPTLDPKEYRGLISTICDLTRGERDPNYIAYSSIHQLWYNHGIPEFEHRLPEVIEELCRREVLIEKEDEGQPTYLITVDLFRRWWAMEYRFINIELDKLK
ncbi:hypothetical protein WA1_22290 [Scytonema hofmannii PCC 7110]|uniref:Tetratricopeptide repeat protein n=1 Tax=Scytonema hofmannii PCC 7110 TaxID=128403 RepID=A0A139X9V1_9CYAN|nr:hypothetical protein [Scytonema hofmannii]KYC41423.1 hypothetical protein WA1_22290 [Scytonema hofmannii PCC 7110]